MPATTFVNLRTVVHKSSGDTSFAFPDVCNTPPLPVPIPYPNIAKSSDAAKTASTVLSDGNPIMVKDSHYALSTGDEAGSAPGNVVTGVIKGKAYFVLYSFDVKAEGKNVCRFLDPMTHNHSSSPPPGTPPGPDAGGTMSGPTQVNLEMDLVTAIVTKVTCQSGIPMESKGINGAVIPNPYPAGALPPSGPNWERVDGKPPPREKTYPATYTIEGGGSDKKVEVDIEITEVEGKYVGKKAELFGMYLGLEIKAKSPITLNKGPIKANMCEFVKLPNKLVYVPSAGIAWFLKVDGLANPVCIGETKIELFFIYAKPQKPWAGKKVWYEALRYAFTDLDVGFTSAPLEIVRKLTVGLHYCGMRYDTVSGASRYMWHPVFQGNFKLSWFLMDVRENPWALDFKRRGKVNCYDNAGLIVLFGSLLGVPHVKSYYLGPPVGVLNYGFIKSTFLVGITDLCNNPFYENSSYNPNPNVADDDERRSDFGNHAFGACGITAFDSCAGPYKGDGGPKKYVTESVDGRRTKSQYPGWKFSVLLAGSYKRYDVNAFS